MEEKLGKIFDADNLDVGDEVGLAEIFEGDENLGDASLFGSLDDVNNATDRLDIAV